MGLHSVIANGGKVVVVGGKMNPSWNRFANNPQVVFWTGDRSEIERHFRTGGRDNLPDNTRGVILSRFINHAISTRVLSEAKRKKALIMGVKNDGEVTKMLEQITGEDKKPISTPPLQPQQEVPAVVAETMRRPKAHELAQYATKYDDRAKSIKQSTESIQILLRAAGIQTTDASLAQSIGKLRRDSGFYAKPGLANTLRTKAAGKKAQLLDVAAVKEATATAAAAPPAPVEQPAMDSNIEVLLKMIADLQAGITLLDAEVRKMHAQTQEYRQLEEKLAQLGFRKS